MQGIVKLLQLDLRQGGTGRKHSGVVEETIDPAKFLNGRPNHPANICLNTHVSTHEACSASETGSELFTFVFSAARDYHPRTFCDEQFRSLRAYAASGARDYSHFSIKHEHQFHQISYERGTIQRQRLSADPAFPVGDRLRQQQQTSFVAAE